jgi:hypothetical protein
MPPPTRYTPTQLALLKLFSDGNRHRRSEIVGMLQEHFNDPLVDVRCMHNHIYLLREKLRKLGQDIICEYNERIICYRHVVLLNSGSS